MRTTSPAALPKIILLFATLVLGGQAWGTPIAPGTSVVPGTADAAGSIKSDTGLLPFTIGSATGDVREIVVADALNPFAAGDFTLIFQVDVTTGTATDIEISGVDSLTLDVSQASPHPPFVTTGNITAISANRFTSGVLEFDLNPVNAGESSVALLIRTNGTTNIPVTITVSGIPEPATLALLGVALAGLGFSRRSRK